MKWKEIPELAKFFFILAILAIGGGMLGSFSDAIAGPSIDWETGETQDNSMVMKTGAIFATIGIVITLIYGRSNKK